MPKKQIALFAIFFTLAIGGFAPLTAQDRKTGADNTGQNQRDRSKTEPTADQAKNTLTDREIMQQIRKAVVSDKSLSTDAHNVKIVAQNGQVTLRGAVHSETEKQSIEQKAADVAGAGKVTDEITIKAAGGQGK